MTGRYFIFCYQALLSIVLSLSSSLICAEVLTKGAKTANAYKESESVVPVQSSEDAATALVLHAEQWELARSGETILELPVLKQVTNAWLSDKQKMIEIQYPGGEDGEFWVHELTDWLVSLGIPSNYLVTTPGSGADDVIKFNLIKNMK